MEIIKQSKQALELAVKAINAGKVVVCPTDTVYGFLADASNKKAVDKIFKIKKRPKTKPLAVFVKDLKMAKKLAEIDASQEKILKQKWPGKYTFILKFKSEIRNPKSETNPKFQIFKLSKLVIGKNGTIALRIPKYKFLNDLFKKIDKPLAQTSVNISGQSPLTKISDILRLCKKCGMSDVPQILIINGGDLPKSKPSKIIDLTGQVLTRLR